ncbi:MAG: GNAT family N-acetyltransferase [Chloroflexi bacterium]|nr:GNAT family N-acetyltransferase [Chloroflexota bacterium]MCY3583560.1 GNAT family N-acetyltransferase [Chloroflexota bacterium]MCY3715796.1 GNAT family N-acetyltransferase [Chloroflexota bacterium]MDE2651027.1 GNAT family N-acetyltransferase [Chloroflexota bacterium]MXX52268.1 GNAT family N-acetyltransferase [Chloroflexota bacterium]
MSTMIIRPLERADREWVAHFLDDRWGTTTIVSRGKMRYGHLLEGLVALRAEAESDSENTDAPTERIGLLTVEYDAKECEILTLDSLVEGMGVGSALLDALEERAREAGLQRLWLVTTNDNLASLRFWQKRGYELVAVHRNAIAAARRIKPQIPITGRHGIPIRDEIELEKNL